MTKLAWFVIALVLTTICQAAEPPRSVLERALHALDPNQQLSHIDALEIRFDGQMNLSARHQGKSPDENSWVPISERVVIDLARDRIAYHLHWFNYVHSKQQLQEIHDASGRVLFLDRYNGGGGWSASPPVPDARDRYRRLLPPLLISEAQANAHRVEKVCRPSASDCEIHAVRYRTPTDDLLTLRFDVDGLLASVHSVIDMPLMGSVPISWHYSDYTGFAGLRVPQEMVVELNHHVLKRSSVTYAHAKLDQAFAIPAEYGSPPEPESWRPEIPAGETQANVTTIADGVYAIHDIRPGFQVMFVEFEDFVIAVDAPSGWFEMQQMPPMNWSPGDSARALGDKFVRAIKSTLPNKPIRYLVLSHHHSDHIGGLLPFVEEGAILLAGTSAATAARQYLRNMGAGPASLERIQGRHVIEDNSMRMELIELPIDNPHAANYLAVYLPPRKLMYTSAFIYPLPERVFPLQSSIPAMQWFVAWLDASGLAVDTLLNVHGSGSVQAWQLEWARRSMNGTSHKAD